MTLNITLLNIGDTGYTFSNHDESIEKLKVIDVCKTDDGIYYYKCKDEICNFEIAAEKVLFLPEIVNITKSIDVNDLPKDSDSLYQYAMNIYKALDTIYGNRTQEQFLNDIKNHG
jgi:hypothetical protein